MKYRVGEVQNMTDGRDSHVGFNILNSHGAPIVTFSYLDRADAAKCLNRRLVAHAEAPVVCVNLVSEHKARGGRRCPRQRMCYDALARPVLPGLAACSHQTSTSPGRSWQPGFFI